MDKEKRRRITIRFVLAVIAAKASRAFIKTIKKKAGSNTPGNLAIKICPDFLEHVILPKIIVAVTGSNGKTSTSNYINDMLIKCNFKTMNNSEGSNMPAGIATCIIAASSIFGKSNKDIAVFEIDERASALIYRYITPTHLVCTNLFRDSIFRNGHSEFVLSKINEKLPKTTTLILNADDLISSSIGTDENKKVYFGVAKQPSDTKMCESVVCDCQICPKCKNALEFEYVHYNHIGKAHCTRCNFTSPIPDFLASNILQEESSFEIISENGTKVEQYNFKFDTLFNIYNITAAITVLKILGINSEQIKESLKDLKVKSSRKDSIETCGLKITKMLSKNQNPISCSRTMDFVSKSSENKVVILAVTDPNGDKNGSEDISWLYDTDMEYLNQNNIKQILVFGKRSSDVVLRLLIAGIKKEIIKENVEYTEVENTIDYTNIESIYILHSLYADSIAKGMMEDIKKKVEQDNV